MPSTSDPLHVYEVIKHELSSLGYLRNYQIADADYSKAQEFKLDEVKRADDSKRLEDEFRRRDESDKRDYLKRGHIEVEPGLYYSLGLGIRGKDDALHTVSGAKIEVWENLVVCFIAESQRDEYHQGYRENGEVFQKLRAQGVLDNDILRKLPHPVNLLRSMNAYSIQPNWSGWRSLALGARDALIERIGEMPKVGQVVPIFSGVQGYQPVLTVWGVEVKANK